MAEFPAVQSVGQLLSEMSNRDAQTNQMLANTQFINARVPYEQAATAELLQNTELAKKQAARNESWRQYQLGQLMQDPQIQNTGLYQGAVQSGQQQQVAERQSQQSIDALVQQDRARQQQGPINRNDPSTPSVSDSQSSNPATPQYSDPNAQKEQEYTKLARKAAFDAKMAAAIGVDPKENLALQKHYEDKAKEYSTEVTKKRQDDVKETANIMSGVRNPEQLSAAVQHIADTFGKDAAFNVDKQLLHAPDGSYLWNKSQQDRLKQFSNQFTTANEQFMQDFNLRKIVGEEANWKSEAARRDAETRQGESRIAIERERAGIAGKSLNLRQAAFDATLGKGAISLLMADQKRIDAEAAKSKIPDYTNAYNVANRTATKLTGQGGFDAITPALGADLVQQAGIMMRNESTRVGGTKQEMQNIGKMNSFLDKWGLWLTSFGQGEKYLAKDRMLELAREMQNVYADRNANVVKEELKVVQQSMKKTPLAYQLTMHGSLENAVATGRAVKTKDGKYVAFLGPDGKPSPENTFALPDQNDATTKYFELLKGATQGEE